MYRWVLPRISPLDAAAYVRPIIEREAALQVVADREFYGRNPYHVAYDRRVWADDVLAREGLSQAGRRQAAADRIAHRAGAYISTPHRGGGSGSTVCCCPAAPSLAGC